MPVERVKKGKKGKVFLDNSQMLSIIDKVNSNIDDQIEKKVKRMTHIKELESKRQQKLNERKNFKKAELEKVKKRISNKKNKNHDENMKKSQESLSSNNNTLKSHDAEHNQKTTHQKQKKKVTFQLEH